MFFRRKYFHSENSSQKVKVYIQTKTRGRVYKRSKTFSPRVSYYSITLAGHHIEKYYYPHKLQIYSYSNSISLLFKSNPAPQNSISLSHNIDIPKTTLIYAKSFDARARLYRPFFPYLSLSRARIYKTRVIRSLYIYDDDGFIAASCSAAVGCSRWMSLQLNHVVHVRASIRADGQIELRAWYIYLEPLMRNLESSRRRGRRAGGLTQVDCLLLWLEKKSIWGYFLGRRNRVDCS